jgi:protocatechuate 3,4-dioxygenase alpha subunit
MSLLPTPSQTVGPFFHLCLRDDVSNRLISEDDGDAVRIQGVVLDGAGDPVPDGMIEIWQANRAGRYAHPDDPREELRLEEAFTGFGRCATNEQGRYEFLTVKPGRVPDAHGVLQAPHVLVGLFARGLLKRLVTRIYFPDEQEANGHDPVLGSIADEAQRATIVARPTGSGLTFDIRLQGEGQTAFFDV